MTARKAKIGFLDDKGHPYIKINVWGMVGSQHGQEFDAMIDTGFTGFLSMPLTQAFPLALALFGTTSYELADGSISPKLLAWGHVQIEDEDTHGVIVLEPNSTGLLLGMEFLKKLDRMLLVSKAGVFLMEELEAIVTAGTQSTTEATGEAEAAPPTEPPSSNV